MTRQAPITAETGITGFPLEALYLSDLNPRQDVDAEGIDLLADSIAICGLIQNLAGIEDGNGKIAIVAGGRRLRALARLAERDPGFLDHRPELALIPVRLARDEAEARAWASAENAARADLHPADEIRAYGRMREAGAEVASIARVFGTTEAKVYRRLALAALPVPVLDALRAGEISYSVATAFTVSNDEARSLAVLEKVRGVDHVTDHRVRKLLQPEAVALSDRRARFVGLDAYAAEGGNITRDLFEDSAFLTDPDILDRLFIEKLDAAAAEARAEGWKWVEPFHDSWLPYTYTEKLKRIYRTEGDLTEEQAERYDELAELANAEAIDEEGETELDALQAILDGDFTAEQRQHSGIFVYVGPNGELRREGAYIRREDCAEAIAAEVLTGHAATSAAAEAAPKSPYSAALVEDMKAARLHALQSALLSKPELLLDLLAFMFTGNGGTLEALFDLRPAKANITPSKPEGLNADPRLDDPEADGMRGWMEDAERIEAFAAFQSEGKKARNAALSVGLARTLPYPHRQTGFFDHIENMAGADLRRLWTPTAEGFFSRVSADYLDALLLDLTGCDPHGNGYKAFKSCKKADKAHQMERLFTCSEYQSAWRIDAEKKARIDAWLPGCF